jgi:hypothetical protein
LLDVPDFYIYHTYRDSFSKTQNRALLDIQLLKKQLTNKNDLRTLYYLAHSYDILERYVDAYEYYQKRIQYIIQNCKEYTYLIDDCIQIFIFMLM